MALRILILRFKIAPERVFFYFTGCVDSEVVDVPECPSSVVHVVAIYLAEVGLPQLEPENVLLCTSFLM